MASIALKTLSVFLGLFFVFVGLMKLTPRINTEMHRNVRRMYVQHAKVFPLAQTLGYKLSSKWYRRVVGALEVASGFILLFIPGFLKQVANVILLLLTVCASYSYIMLGDRFDKLAPAIVFSLMLSCRLVVYLQVTHREKTLLAEENDILKAKNVKSE